MEPSLQEEGHPEQAWQASGRTDALVQDDPTLKERSAHPWLEQAEQCNYKCGQHKCKRPSANGQNLSQGRHVPNGQKTRKTVKVDKRISSMHAHKSQKLLKLHL